MPINVLKNTGVSPKREVVNKLLSLTGSFYDTFLIFP